MKTFKVWNEISETFFKNSLNRLFRIVFSIGIELYWYCAVALFGWKEIRQYRSAPQNVNQRGWVFLIPIRDPNISFPQYLDRSMMNIYWKLIGQLWMTKEILLSSGTHTSKLPEPKTPKSLTSSSLVLEAFQVLFSFVFHKNPRLIIFLSSKFEQ